MAALTTWDASEFTPVAGTRIHAAVLGPIGVPEVVCVHGLTSHRYFLPFAARLAPAARVVAPDLPGFGRTNGPPQAHDVRGLSHALAEWLSATGRGGVVLVANSTGCQVIIDMAVHARDLLGPVVLASPTMDRHARSAGRHTARSLHANLFERPSLARLLVRDYLDCGLRRFLATFVHMLRDPVERKLPLVDSPAIVVRGGRDPIVPHRWAAEVAERLPSARLVEVAGGSHALNHSAPDELARITRELLHS